MVFGIVLRFGGSKYPQTQNLKLGYMVFKFADRMRGSN